MTRPRQTKGPTVKLNLSVGPDFAKALKIEARSRGITVSELVEEAVNGRIILLHHSH